MADLIRTLAAASRATGPVKGVITAVDTTSGRVQVTANGATITATATDQTLSSATVGAGALLIPVAQTFVLVATMGGSILAPNLVPNGTFSNPGDGLPPAGWTINQDGTAQLDFVGNASDGPSAGWCGQIMVWSMGDNQALSVISSPNFTVDAGTAYTLSFDAIADPGITNCVVWPSLQCYATGDTWWGQNVTNGVLSPNVGSSWGVPYSTVLTIPDQMNSAYVDLGIFCDTTSVGNIYLANVSLTANT